jgi:sarcosine oxidase/L-pipecolate oxidase
LVNNNRFLPVAGKYMCNVLKGQSNGDEKDRAWKWKSGEELKKKQAKEFGDSPRKEGLRKQLREYDDAEGNSKL